MDAWALGCMPEDNDMHLSIWKCTHGYYLANYGTISVQNLRMHGNNDY